MTSKKLSIFCLLMLTLWSFTAQSAGYLSSNASARATRHGRGAAARFASVTLTTEAALRPSTPERGLRKRRLSSYDRVASASETSGLRLRRTAAATESICTSPHLDVNNLRL